MTLAMFKLESFTTALAGHGAKLCYDRQALEKAHADGVAEGLARQEDDQIKLLSLTAEACTVLRLTYFQEQNYQGQQMHQICSDSEEVHFIVYVFYGLILRSNMADGTFVPHVVHQS